MERTWKRVGEGGGKNRIGRQVSIPPQNRKGKIGLVSQGSRRKKKTKNVTRLPAWQERKHRGNSYSALEVKAWAAIPSLQSRFYKPFTHRSSRLGGDSRTGEDGSNKQKKGKHANLEKKL